MRTQRRSCPDTTKCKSASTPSHNPGTYFSPNMDNRIDDDLYEKRKSEGETKSVISTFE